jgi:hypothetical protein
MTNQFPDATKMVFPPNDLSHLSDEEFNALAPQGYHATGPAEPLSPAAQSVLDALYMEELNGPQQLMARAHAAAALRAAADQIKDPYPSDQLDTFDKIQSQLLAIAAELDNNATH